MNKPTKAKATKTVTTKELLRVCVRCADCAKGRVDPALRQLFVLWASPATPPGESDTLTDQPAQSRFALAKTDDGGYLSPVFAETEASPTKTIPVVAGVKYRFYFVRHPDGGYVRGLAERLNTALGLPDELKKFVAEFGEAKELEGKIDTVIFRKKKKSCLIFEIPEDPEWFVPRGSDLYDGWVLFRGMPGSGIVLPSTGKRKQSHLQCAKITTQVTRLQHHLGTLRYPIGNPRHPYTPEPWVNAYPERSLPTEGMFEEVTWNGVLRFQCDARDGIAAVLDGSKTRKPTVSGANFDPVPDPHHERERNDSLSYVTTVEVKLATPPGMPHLTVVDRETGDTVKVWLEKGYRKPGKILVCLGRLDEWLHEDAYDSLSAFSKELKSLGFTAGVVLNSGLRDVRSNVSDVNKGGRVKRSIHKSGFAFDFAMDSYRFPRRSAPLFWAPDGGAAAVQRMRTGAKLRWVVYALVRRSDIAVDPLPAHAKYVDRIDRWIYDSTHPDGGYIRSTTAHDAARETTVWAESAPADAYAFLNFTTVAESELFRLTRISAKGGWQQVRPAAVMKSTDLSSFAGIVSRIAAHVTEEALMYGPAGDQIRIGDDTYKLTPDDRDSLPRNVRYNPTQTATDLRALVAYYKAWLGLTGAVGTSLTLHVQRWTRSGATIVNGLATSEGLKNQKADVVADLPSGGPARSDRVTLGPDVELPTYSFYVEPVPPLPLDIGTEVSFPAVPGDPANMEWWHYQYVPGYTDATGKHKTWGEILGSIGWTEKGLTYVGPVKGNAGAAVGIYGFQGIGYKPSDLAEKAK